MSDKIRDIKKISIIKILEEKISMLLVRLPTKNLLIISLVKIALEVRIKLAIDCIAAIAQRPKIPKNIYFQINVHHVEEKLLKNSIL